MNKRILLQIFSLTFFLCILTIATKSAITKTPFNLLSSDRLDNLIISGTINQRLNYSYEVEVRFEILKKGEVSGVTIYPSLDCIGYLTYLRKEGNRYYFQEFFRSKEGKQNCVDKGTVVISILKANQFSFDWYYLDNHPGATGILLKGKLK